MRGGRKEGRKGGKEKEGGGERVGKWGKRGRGREYICFFVVVGKKSRKKEKQGFKKQNVLFFLFFFHISSSFVYLPEAGAPVKVPKKATQTVVSSITCSSRIHLSLDSLMRRSTAKRGSVVRTAMSMTS